VHVTFDFVIGGRDYFRSCGDDEYLSAYDGERAGRRIDMFEGSTGVGITRDGTYARLDALFLTRFQPPSLGYSIRKQGDSIFHER
jgi:hypothetical protein